MPTGRLFTGQRLDASTGLYDYGARLYDPWLGRFISAEPVPCILDNPKTLNRYAYVENNPVRYIDPTGLRTYVVPGIGGLDPYIRGFGEELERQGVKDVRMVPACNGVYRSAPLSTVAALIDMMLLIMQ